MRSWPGSVSWSKHGDRLLAWQMTEDDPLFAVLSACERGAQHAETHPLDWIDWTFAQADFVELVQAATVALFRAGNQVGKTYVGAGLTIDACITSKIEAWVVCTSWSQSVAIMTKVWDLAPKDRLAPGQRFSRRRGFGKDNPCLEFVNGSILRFRTTNQGPEALAGATVDWIWIDEPTDEEIYRELQKRVMRRGGKVIITLTPVNRDCVWLRKLVESGAIPEVHSPLNARALTFARTGIRMRDQKGRVMDDAWIVEEIRKTPAQYVPVVIHGEWETRLEGVFYALFDTTKHVNVVTKFKLAQAGTKVSWLLGIDYAAADREFGQCASLCRVLEVPRAGGGYDVWVYIADELVMGGVTDSDEFAGDLIGMLERNGIEWSDLAAVHGDNPVASAWEQKSNRNTMRCVSNRIGVPQRGLVPLISNAKDGKGSGTQGFDHGVRQIYGWMARDRVMVHPRCTHTIKGFQTWDLSTTHPYKDICDAVRYALKPVVFRYSAGGRVGGVSVRTI